MVKQMESALEKAKIELSRATHYEDCGKNAGIRKMNANKAEWLKWIVYLAELGLETEKLLAGAETEEAANAKKEEHTCTSCSCASKDKLIEDLGTINEELRSQLETLSAALKEEEMLRNNLILEAKFKWAVDLAKRAHDRCWLDGADLVCSLDWLDHEINSLVESVR
jgi:hypothetical protein